MKKFITLMLLLPMLQQVSSQDLRDAFRYSSTELTGTARFMGMSGAFGALGGDISAISLNPASSAVFLSSSASLSFGNRNLDRAIGYNNGLTNSENSDFEMGNIGGVFVFTGQGDNNWKKFSVGINYNSTSDYNENYIARGTSNTSIDQYFLDYSNGVELDLLQLRDDENISDLYSFLGENYGFGVQQAFLGYQGFITEATDDQPSNSEYLSLIAPGTFNQRYNYAATGLNGKLSFNFATQFKDYLYLGVNLNSHFINYENSTEFREQNNNSGSETTQVVFGNNLRTNGEGFSFQIGGIAKLSDEIRVGLSYDSPIWYDLREETTQYLETNTPQNEVVRVNPNIINIYPEYRLQTPGKVSGSLAYLFGRQGLVSFDYSIKDYSNIKFRPENEISYQILNDQIEDRMTTASSYRIGGEYRISNFSLRAGYRFEESPFQNNSRAGELNGYSAGLGYSFRSLNLDLAYSFANYTNETPVFNTGLTDPVKFENDLSNILFSISFGL